MLYSILIVASILASSCAFNAPENIRSKVVFDPFNFVEKASNNELVRYKEAELKHSRWAMIGATALPIIESKTQVPAIHAFDYLSDEVKTLILGAIATGEGMTILKGYENPFSLKDTNSYFKMKEDYIPGDIGLSFDEKLVQKLEMKELISGRIAMVGFILMTLQELITNKSIL
jgi:hypothetical protein